MATTEDFGGDPAASEGPGDVEAAFQQALTAEAAAAPAAIPAPPRATVSADPDAPHGRDEQGEPLTPYGRNKRTGRPNLKAAGPGRGGGKADQPRTTSRAVSRAPARTTAPAGRDYSEELSGLAMAIWMGGASLPAARPYAHLFKQAMPGMVHAWNEAAGKNETVRGYCEKLAGEGSWAWVIGVSVTTGPFLMGCWQLARKEADPARALEQQRIRKELSEACESEFKEYMTEQVRLVMAEQEAAA